MTKCFPFLLSFSPWKAPEEVQRQSKCIIGVDYPEPIIDLTLTSQRNTKMMQSIGEKLIINGKAPDHCRPSNIDEIRHFFWLPEEIVVEC